MNTHPYENARGRRRRAQKSIVQGAPDAPKQKYHIIYAILGGLRLVSIYVIDCHYMAHSMRFSRAPRPVPQHTEHVHNIMYGTVCVCVCGLRAVAASAYFNVHFVLCVFLRTRVLRFSVRTHGDFCSQARNIRVYGWVCVCVCDVRPTCALVCVSPETIHYIV